MDISLKPKELSMLLKECVKNRMTVLIKGKPGVGKTSIVQQVSDELGYDCYISHPSIQSPTVYMGLGVYDRENQKAKFLPYDFLERLVHADKPTVAFLDDFGQALPSVQAAIQNLLSSRQVGDHKVSDNVVFVIATNDRNQGAYVNGVLSTIKSRCGTILQLDTDAEHWLNWAVKNGIRPEVTGFIRLRPEMLCQFEVSNEIVNFPCPRTVENVSKILDMECNDFLKNVAIIGAVGEGFATEFEGWLRLYKNMVSPDYIIANPTTAEVPEGDALIAITSALAYKANKENLGAIVTYGERLSPEYNVNMIEYYIMAKNPKLKETGEYAKWVVKNQRYLGN